MTHLALSFPGMSYGHEQPVLLTIERALTQSGAVVEPVEYPVLAEWAGQSSFWTAEREARFVADVLATTREALGRHDPDRLTLVGKSLGTHALAAVAGEVAVPAGTGAIWVTPLFGEQAVFDAARSSRWRALYIVGSADAAHVPTRHDEVVAATDGRTVAIEGADHALEVDGDVLAMVDGWRRIAAAVLELAALTGG